MVFFSLIITCLLLVSCNEGVELEAVDGRYKKSLLKGKEVIFIDGDDLVPPSPDFEVDHATVAGVDADKDGVRDDIERWINENVSIRKERIILKRMVQLQSEGLVNNTDKDSVHESLFYWSEAYNCLKFYSEKDVDHLREIVSELKARLVNTTLRQRANAKRVANAGGALMMLGGKESCEKAEIRL